MTDDTLPNGLKAIFGTSQSATTIASTNLIPFMASNGDPVGLTGMANLASVLGGMTFSMYPENVVGLKQGVYLAAGSSGGDAVCQNLPSNAWYYLIVFNRHQDGTIAFAMQTNTSTLYMATIDSNATSVSWTRIATQ